ncbi:MAG: tetratricopeptide repeat protein [Acidobacteriaceae bacterium]|nr:tetratricopeptide repeat protein [Acidobacteriaceae bacterium]
MRFRCLHFLCCFLFLASWAQPASVLVLPLHNASQYSDLNWVGEAVADVLLTEFGSANQIVVDRDSMTEGFRRLSLRRDADWTKASLIRLGQSLDVDYVCHGSYDASLPPGVTDLRKSTIRITAHFIDLRKMHDGPELSEAGPLVDLSRSEEHLAWQSLKYLAPDTDPSLDAFLSPQKSIRIDAQESYVRGLLSPSGEQQQKWFAQAVVLDPHFANPIFELGKIALERRDYRGALSWFGRIPAGSPLYDQARFKMGLSAYRAGDYSSAANNFRQVATVYPLNEIYNNLGAAEIQLNQPNASDDLRRALEGDTSDPVYTFNFGIILLKSDQFDEAATRFQSVLDSNPDDAEARSLLDRARSRLPVTSSSKLTATARLKENYDEAAFRQMKSMFQAKRAKS